MTWQMTWQMSWQLQSAKVSGYLMNKSLDIYNKIMREVWYIFEQLTFFPKGCTMDRLDNRFWSRTTSFKPVFYNEYEATYPYYSSLVSLFKLLILLMVQWHYKKITTIDKHGTPYQDICFIIMIVSYTTYSHVQETWLHNIWKKRWKNNNQSREKEKKHKPCLRACSSVITYNHFVGRISQMLTNKSSYKILKSQRWIWLHTKNTSITLRSL